MATIHDNQSSQYSDRIRDFILKTGFPLENAPAALGISNVQFIRWWNTGNRALVGYQNLRSLCQFVEATEEQILFGTYQFDQVRARILETNPEMPGEYAQNQFSYTRSSAHIFKYLVLTRGQHFADQILKKLRVSPLIYQDLDNKISLSYFLDLLETLENSGITGKEIDTIAGVLFLSFENTPLGNRFAAAKRYYECYQTLAENMNILDENFIYTFEIDSSQLRLKAFLPFDRHQHIHFTPEKLARLHRYRQVLLGWFPYLSGQAPVLPQVTYDQKPDGIVAQYSVYFYGSRTRPLFLCPETLNQG